ncbi:MAG TPA: YceI family protein [Polyangiaceae bacterium]|nr:YceI family protein [Polyangiaceae bacterium]
MTLSNTTTTPTSSTRNQAQKPAGTFAIDASHSHVGFAVRHMMVSNVRGEFTKLSGTVSYDPTAPEATRVDVKIDVASLNTREEKRDAHLRSGDFFDAEHFPHITFVSKSARRRDDGLEVVGDLTIHGTAREVKLAVDDITAEHTDPWGGKRIGASARTKIRRSDFGMRWNAALEAGGVLVGDEISIELEVELIRQ